MIISNSHNYIFFHIPKNGGTSLTHILDSGLRWNDVIIGGTELGEQFNIHWDRRFKLFKHSTPTGVQQVIGKHAYAGFRKFAITREPIERFKSATQFLYQVVAVQEHGWALNAFSPESVEEIRAFKDVSSMIHSKLLRSIVEKRSFQCNECELFFRQQIEYYDREGHANGTFTYFRLEELSGALEALEEMGILAFRGEPEPVKRQAEMVNLHRNKSLKALGEDLDDTHRAILREIYKDDYTTFYPDL